VFFFAFSFIFPSDNDDNGTRQWRKNKKFRTYTHSGNNNIITLEHNTAAAAEAEILFVFQ
jgi:hypothetical protein